MNLTIHNRLVSFIWSIANYCLRDVHVREYRTVFLPIVVLRRLDALITPTNEFVMEEIAFQRDEAGFTKWHESGLRDASGYVFYNNNEWTLQRLYDTALKSQQFLQANFEDTPKSSTYIKEAFDPFYISTLLSGATGVNVSNERHNPNKTI